MNTIFAFSNKPTSNFGYDKKFQELLLEGDHQTLKILLNKIDHRNAQRVALDKILAKYWKEIEKIFFN